MNRFGPALALLVFASAAGCLDPLDSAQTQSEAEGESHDASRTDGTGEQSDAAVSQDATDDSSDPDAGNPDAVEPDAGPADAGEADPGSPDAGPPKTGSDAGESTDGGLPPGPFTWAQTPGVQHGDQVFSLHGSSPTNVFAVTGRGVVLRSRGGTFNEVWRTTRMSAATDYLRAVHVTPSGKVVAGGVVGLHCVSAPCDRADLFKEQAVQGWIEGICARGEEVYASGHGSSRGKLWKFDFSAPGWVLVSDEAGDYSNRRCTISENNDLFIANRGGVVRVTPAGLATFEPLEPPGGSVNLLDVEVVGSRLFAVGSEGMVAERDATSSPVVWRRATEVSSTSPFRTIAATSRGDAIAAGMAGFYRFDGTRWEELETGQPGAPPARLTFVDLWSSEADSVHGAALMSNYNGILLVGTR